MKALLVIDRRRRTRRELRSLLEARYQVLAVRSIFSAFRLLRRRRFDVVLVKTAAHDAHAIAVLKWLQLRAVQIPVVALLGWGASGDARIVRQLGASAVLRWPTPGNKLLEAIASARTLAVPAGASEALFLGRDGHVCPACLERSIHGATRSLPGDNHSYTRSIRYRDHHRAAWYIHGRGRGRLC